MPLLLTAAIAVKIIPALVFRLNHTWREAFAAGILMCPRLSLIIAAAAIGEKLGIIDESVNAAIVGGGCHSDSVAVGIPKGPSCAAGESSARTGNRYPACCAVTSRAGDFTLARTRYFP